MLKMYLPERPAETLKALSASGVQGIAPKARAELRARIHAEIRAELAKRGGKA